MPIDLIFIIVFGFGFRHGYTRGIISAAFNVVAYVFGIIFAFKITPTTTNILETMFHSQNPTMFIAAFVVNLALILLILRTAASAFERGLQAVYLGFFNRILGGVAMAILAVLIYSVLLWFVIKVQFINDATISESKTYPLLKELPPAAKSFALRLKPFATEVWDTSLGWMDRLDKYGIQKTETQPKVYEVPKGKNFGIENEPEQNPAPRPPTAADNGIEE